MSRRDYLVVKRHSLEITTRELRGRDKGRLIDPTRRTGEYDASVDPTRLLGELDGLLHPIRRTGELVGASGPTRPFGELDYGCFVVRDPLSEALSNPSRRLIV
ncbi:hypothetical protein IGI04_025541 [Brassica rapa subsp. trilocularis]|uniref:Uncharacterized protein n=1 Tax=Brassica rapa subsp. trilocularis TaxID=1813537 RepID=A0ABQ7KWI5_BRACM|nr:hypothetical protein IGI04_025541 [Brassica rapa subsp. trilocularis]